MPETTDERVKRAYARERSIMIDELRTVAAEMEQEAKLLSGTNFVPPGNWKVGADKLIRTLHAVRALRDVYPAE